MSEVPTCKFGDRTEVSHCSLLYYKEMWLLHLFLYSHKWVIFTDIKQFLWQFLKYVIHMEYNVLNIHVYWPSDEVPRSVEVVSEVDQHNGDTRLLGQHW